MKIDTMQFDVNIQAGQSNAEGMGLGEVINRYESNDSIYYLTAEKSVQHTSECVLINFADKPFNIQIAEERKSGDKTISDFALFFARKYIESKLLKSTRKLLIIRAGIGGTGFKKGNWGVNDLLYNKMLEMTDYALSLNKNNRVVAFLWHQGEHDAFERNEPSVFEKQLFSMVTSVRERYGNMPFIAGDFVREWKQKNIEICEPIIQKIKKVINDIDNATFIDTSDLLSNNEKIGNGDDIHFCRESLLKLGERYCENYIQLIKE